MDPPDDHTAAVQLVGDPGALVRIGAMVRQLLGEARSDSLDEGSRARLQAVHAAALREVERVLPPELCTELARLAPAFPGTAVPSAAELRIAQAQLVGWLEGLFHGIQTALVLQQAGAQAQLDGLRRGAAPRGGRPPEVDLPAAGTYL